MRVVTINVDEPVYARFRSYAERSGRSAAELIRDAMAEYEALHIPRRTSIFDGEAHSVGSVLRDLTADDDLLDEMLS
jgi:predicted transcriptional regulator